MTKSYGRFLVAILAPLILSTGCAKLKGLADFQISISNRTDHTLLIYVNGMEQGKVGAGRSQSFVVRVKAVDNGYTGPSSSAQVTVTARDLTTMKLSHEKKLYIYEDRPENVEFNPSDFQ